MPDYGAWIRRLWDFSKAGQQQGKIAPFATTDPLWFQAKTADFDIPQRTPQP